MKKLLLERIWYIAIAAVIAVSIVIQIVLLLTGGADANSGETGAVASVGTRLLRLFLFFTIDSNIVVFIVSLLLAFSPNRRGFWRDAPQLNALVAITITGIVYALLLAPNIHIDGWALVTMIGLHAISPIAFVSAWLLFGPRRQFQFDTVLAAFILPIIWIIVTFTHGWIGGWYPYPFLDVTDIGLPSALRNAALILAVGIVIALTYWLLDAKLPKRK